jgi:Flp pilus assembly protein CpaB
MKRVVGFDFATAALIMGGAVLIAISIVAATVLVSPPHEPAVAITESTPTPDVTGHTSAALPADRVATVLTVDAAAGAAGAARPGDHVDVFGYFAHQANGGESITRSLMADVPVLSVDRTGSSVALTLAVPQESALLLQEAQALGGQAFVALRPLQPLASEPASFSDTDLASRLAAGNHAQ